MTEEELIAMAEERNLQALQLQADDLEAQRAFEQGFEQVRPSEQEIRAMPKKPSPKREQRDFAQQVNAKAKRGDSGGAGARVRPKAPSNAEGTYKINKGDTLSGIAKRTGIGLAELARLNGLEGDEIHRIRAGDSLRLREDPPAPPPAAMEEGPSLLAQKIKAAQAKGNPSALEAVRGINLDNKFNGGINAALDTASNYVGAVGSGVAGAAAGPIGGLLRNVRLPQGVAPSPARPAPDYDDLARHLIQLDRRRGWK